MEEVRRGRRKRHQYAGRAEVKVEAMDGGLEGGSDVCSVWSFASMVFMHRLMSCWFFSCAASTSEELDIVGSGDSCSCQWRIRMPSRTRGTKTEQE